jgi:hypothetical protein
VRPLHELIRRTDPFRSNNAIVDIQFEEEMSAMAEERKFGDWEVPRALSKRLRGRETLIRYMRGHCKVFAEYLKTHPANPQQWITPSHDISWFVFPVYIYIYIYIELSPDKAAPCAQS